MSEFELIAGGPLDQLESHLANVVNKSWNFAGRCTTFEEHLSNAVFGLAGEAGEVADELKKFLYHQEKPKETFVSNIKKELGDVYFYLLKVQDLLGLSTEEILALNREKLESRHPELGKVTERFAQGYIK